MTNSEYYSAQLEKVKPLATEYDPTIKIFANGNGEDTKHISLNFESAAVLVEWLTVNYLGPQYMLKNDEAWEGTDTPLKAGQIYPASYRPSMYLDISIEDYAKQTPSDWELVII